MKKDDKIAIAKGTLANLKNGFYTLPTGEQVNFRWEQNLAKDNTQYFAADALDERLAAWAGKAVYTTQFEAVQQSTLEGLYALAQGNDGRIGVLNFASAKNAGGGFLGGAEAQEETLARSSGLYHCLLKAPQYYELHRSMHSCVYTDSMIYAPQVPFFRNDAGEFLPTFVLADVLTSPAVNAGVVRPREGKTPEEIISLMRVRMQKVLLLFAENACLDIIVGAWGCGVFQNTPADIAMLFEECFAGKFKGTFRKVLFAIKSNKSAMFEPFQKITERLQGQ